MGKLIGQLLKEDIKSIILWLILPPIAMLIFMTMLLKLGEHPILQMVVGLSTMLIFIAPAIALIQIVVNDWQRFYGKNASFYSGLPLCAGRITAARLINYVLMGIFATLVAIFNVMVIAMITSENAFGPNDFIEVINYIYNYFGGKLFFVIVLYAFVLGVLAVSQVLFSNTLASIKAMSTFGKFGPIITYFATNFIIGFILGRTQLGVSGDYIMSNIEDTSISIDIATNPPYQVLVIPMIISIIMIAIMVYGSYYIHNKKLSVA